MGKGEGRGGEGEGEGAGRRKVKLERHESYAPCTNIDIHLEKECL